MTAHPRSDALRLTAEEINAFLSGAFADNDDSSRSGVVEIEPGRLRAVMPAARLNLRPGGVVSGPTMMSLADMAVYALVLGQIGIVPMAVTTSLTMHFLRPAKPGDLVADAVLLRLGRRIATADVSLWTEAPDRIAAQAIVAYAIPSDA
jgi:uncharacterized protein (TIGR00369 family)